MALDSFIFGGNTGLTYEQLKRRRAVAAALAAQRRGYPKTVGEGMTYLGESIGDMLAERRLDAAEQELQARRDRLMGGVPGAAPAAAPSPATGPGIPPAAPRPPTPPSVRSPAAPVSPRPAPTAAALPPAPVLPSGPSSEAMTSGLPPSEFAMGGILNAAPMAAPNLEATFPVEGGGTAAAGNIPSSGYLPPAATAAAPPSTPQAPTAASPAPGPQSSVLPPDAGDTPPNVLAQAQQVALQGGPAAVSAFMADAGYPKSGAWCGQFAASVLSSSGVQPPAGPAVASNYRNIGTPVDTPQVGDVAIARPGWAPRRGSGETGQVGSHVTFVNQADPTGTFQGLGGNQGSMVKPFNARDFEFRRLPGDVQGHRIIGVPGEEPPPTQLAAYAPTGGVSDAPIPGMGGAGAPRLQPQILPLQGSPPGAEEQVTPTDIEPMPATAQFGPPAGRFSRTDAPVPGVAAAPAPLPPPTPVVSPQAPQGPSRPTVSEDLTKPLPEPAPPAYPDKLTPEEEYGWRMQAASGGDPEIQERAKQWITNGKARRDAEYLRQVELYKADIQFVRQENTNRLKFQREAPETEQKLRTGEEALASKGREAAIAQRFGSVHTYETLVKDVGKSHEKASAAAAVLPNLYDAKEMTKNAITGFGAEARLDYNRALNAFGMTATGDKVRDTQALQAAIAPLVGAILKSTTGTTQVSEGDRKFAQQAAGGDITLDAASIQRILDIGERSFKANIAEHNKQLGSVFTDPQGQDRALHARYRVDMPLSAADQAAKEWLAQNPNDPRAAGVRRKLGM